jgi:hypothetical protein
MHRQRLGACRFVVSGCVAFVFVSLVTLLLPHAASAVPANRAAASAAERAQLTPVVKADVICQRIRMGNKIRTYSCPNNYACVNVAGAWKCRPPGAAPMACSVCYSNFDRDKKACGAGNLPSQANCVNQALAAWKKCLSGCR